MQGINWLEGISSTALLFLHPSTLNASCLSRDLNSGYCHSSWKGLEEFLMGFGQQTRKEHPKEKTVALGNRAGGWKDVP